ncbi:MAG: LiaF domain-containing protein [Proteocatella sp.]
MKNKFAAVLPGIILVLLGGGYLGNTFGLWKFNLFFDGWWTLFILIPCAINLITYGANMFNVIGLIIGTFWLFSAWDIISLRIVWKAVVPILIIAIGMKIIYQNSRNDFTYRNIKQDGSAPNLFAIFGGSNPNYNNLEFHGCNAYAIFGSVDINLRNAIISEDCIINCYALFGGVDILLPGKVKVRTSSTPIFGGVANKYMSPVDENSPTVYVRSTSIFGGVEIK